MPEKEIIQQLKDITIELENKLLLTCCGCGKKTTNWIENDGKIFCKGEKREI